MSLRQIIQCIEFDLLRGQEEFLELFDHLEKTGLIDFNQPFPFPLKTKMTSDEIRCLLGDLMLRAAKIGDGETISLIVRKFPRYIALDYEVEEYTEDICDPLGQAFVEAATHGHREVLNRLYEHLSYDQQPEYCILALTGAFKRGYLLIAGDLISHFKFSPDQLVQFMENEALIKAKVEMNEYHLDLIKTLHSIYGQE